MKENAHADTTPMMDSIHHFVSGGMWHVTWILMVEEK
jgi:hypothetical protein